MGQIAAQVEGLSLLFCWSAASLKSDLKSAFDAGSSLSTRTKAKHGAGTSFQPRGAPEKCAGWLIWR